MSRGWHGERRRHQLAARGISTREQVLRARGVLEDIAEYPDSISIDYNDPEEIFALFWACSQANDFSNFDFDQAFDRALGRVYSQLKMHGLLGAEEYQEYLEEVYPWPMAIDDFIASGGFLDWDKDGILSRIAEMVENTTEFEDYVGYRARVEVDGLEDEELEEVAERWEILTPELRRHLLRSNVSYSNLRWRGNGGMMKSLWNGMSMSSLGALVRMSLCQRLMCLCQIGLLRILWSSRAMPGKNDY